MHPRFLPKPAGRLMAVLALALACTACGKTAPSDGPSSTHSSHAAAATTSSATSSQTTTTSSSSTTTPALPGTGKPTVIVGDKNYTEQFVLGQLYDQALTAQGFKVSLDQNIGPTQVTVQALKAGSLSMYPEYLNTFNTAVAGYRHSFHSQLDAFLGAQHFAVGHDLQLLAPTPFSDTDAIAVTDAYAAEHHLRSVKDLRRVAGELTLGGPVEFRQGAPGLPALKAAYDVSPAAFKAMPDGDQYAELDNGVVQAADVYTTDAELTTGDYALLADPRQIFGWGNVVPVLAAKVLGQEGPAFADIIQRVDDALTTNAIRHMNALVDLGHENPSDVAKQFLQTHGLLTPGDY